MKKIIILVFGIVLIFCMYITFAYANESLYKDVNSNHWAFDTINSISNMGIISGYPDGTFKPDGIMTRAEFSKLLFNAMRLKKSYSNVINYDDVPLNHWAYEYIRTTSEYIDDFSVDGKNIFYPDEAIKRIDVAKAIIKFFKWETKEYDKKTLEKYSDIGSLSNEELNCIAVAYENCILNGYSDGTFKPFTSMTRAEVSKTISNVFLRKSLLEYEKKGISTYGWTYSGDEKIYSKSGDIVEYKIDSNGKFITLEGRLFDDIIAEKSKNNHLKDVSGDVSGDLSGDTSGEKNSASSGETKISQEIQTEKPVQNDTKVNSVKNVSNNNSDGISLKMMLNGENLKDGKTYLINNDEKISATIVNASSGSSYIYYMYSYGKDTKVYKESSSSVEFGIPENVGTGTFKITIWGANTSNNKSFITDTMVVNFRCSGRNALTREEIAAIEEESYLRDTGLSVDEKRELSFKVIFGGDAIKDGDTCDARVKQNITVRGKPVNNIKEIRYKWDDEGFYTLDGSNGSFEIPERFNSNSEHYLTVALVSKDGRISKFGKYVFKIL